MADSRTVDLGGDHPRGRILVAAAGQLEMIRGDWIKPGAAVIDVGIRSILSRMPKARAAGKMVVVGDVAFREAVRGSPAGSPRCPAASVR